MGFIPKLDLPALIQASRAVRVHHFSTFRYSSLWSGVLWIFFGQLGDEGLPDSITFDQPDDIPDQLWSALHHALLEVNQNLVI